MVPFHTQTVVKVLMIDGLSLFLLMCLQKMQCQIVDTHVGEDAKFGRDMDRCSEIENGTIPYSKCSKSINDSWFVSISTHVPTKNANSLTHM